MYYTCITPVKFNQVRGDHLAPYKTSMLDTTRLIRNSNSYFQYLTFPIAVYFFIVLYLYYLSHQVSRSLSDIDIYIVLDLNA